jgi:hypothetical protein
MSQIKHIYMHALGPPTSRCASRSTTVTSPPCADAACEAQRATRAMPAAEKNPAWPSVMAKVAYVVPAVVCVQAALSGVAWMLGMDSRALFGGTGACACMCARASLCASSAPSGRLPRRTHTFAHMHRAHSSGVCVRVILCVVVVPVAAVLCVVVVPVAAVYVQAAAGSCRRRRRRHVSCAMARWQ